MSYALSLPNLLCDRSARCYVFRPSGIQSLNRKRCGPTPLSLNVKCGGTRVNDGSQDKTSVTHEFHCDNHARPNS
ncbi:MAG: hypothetical protein QOD84_322 [Acidobacteriaceae bacterium]